MLSAASTAARTSGIAGCSGRCPPCALPPSGRDVYTAVHSFKGRAGQQNRRRTITQVECSAQTSPARSPAKSPTPSKAEETGITGVTGPSNQVQRQPHLLELRLPNNASPKDLVSAVSTLADSLDAGAVSCLSTASVSTLVATSTFLPSLSKEDLLRLLHSTARLGLPLSQSSLVTGEAAAAAAATPVAIWSCAIHASCRSVLPSCCPAQLTDMLWSLVEFGSIPDAGFLSSCMTAVQTHLLDFTPPQLSKIVCCLGTWGLVAPQPWLAALLQEVRFQVVEFPGDFSPMDLARMISGLADLQAPVDADLHASIMRIVYGRVRTIEERSAVDFALAKLGKDRSIHFDARWTHEELHWLPRRERDKLRMIKEGWYRTVWNGC